MKAFRERNPYVIGITCVLVLAAFAAGACSDSGRKEGAGPTGTLLRLPSMPNAFGLNGSKLAWVDGRVVVADVDSGKRIVLADAPFLEGAVAAGVAASSGFALAAVADAAQEARDVRKF